MVSWSDALVRELAERRVVVFVGAGLSKAACSALPTWPNLLSALANILNKKTDKALVSKLIKKDRLLDAAQIITGTANKADLQQKIVSTFQIRPTPYHDIYNSILQIDPKTIITTNYDEFIERNFDHFNAGGSSHLIKSYTTRNLLGDLRSPVRSIIKMHGCITDPSDIVLDRSSYFMARRNNAGFFATLQALMTVNTVLFLGYSISDPDIQLILENISLQSPSDFRHYALISKFDHPAIRQSLAETYSINFVEYPSGDHGQVPPAIEQLRTRVLEVRETRGIV